MKKLMTLTGITAAALMWGTGQSYAQYVPPPQLVPGVDYSLPNYANSPALTKFMDPLPGVKAAGGAIPGFYYNNIGANPRNIPVGIADTTTFANCAYYEVALVDYTNTMHSELGPTKLRGYVQLETTALLAWMAAQPTPLVSAHYPLPGGKYGVDKPTYLGPTIVATKGVPTRVKFYNLLPTTANGGNLFIPTDVTMDGTKSGPIAGMSYSQNRATLHIHGGDNPWISDGTAHQWITPAGEFPAIPANAVYIKGASQQNVPDMTPVPVLGDGTATFYWPNGQSGRLMFYHDHALGMTRLNVYAGEAAGYLLVDDTEGTLNAFAPGGEIPLVIQDKTFVNDGAATPPGFPAGAAAPAATTVVDPLWATGPWGQSRGSLWFPHVYMPNQNPNDLSGANPMGRVDFGGWFWPVFPVNGLLPQVSSVPEGFMDTPVINGAAYPYLNVEPTAYRFRILNACNDRFVNLQLYVADNIINGITVTSGGSKYTVAPRVTITPAQSDTTGYGAVAVATVDLNPKLADGITANPNYQKVTAVTMTVVGSGYTAVPTVDIAAPPTASGGTKATATANWYSGVTEVGMVPADINSPTTAWPVDWAVQTPGMIPDIIDNRPGGLPDPRNIGPDFVQIGTEGGLLPAPAVLPVIPVGYVQNKRDITVGSIGPNEHTLLLGPAERGDVIIDFTAFKNKTLILYSDSPAPVPAGDPRNDYYTGGPDMTGQGGAPATQAGFGPNTRTLMQIRVSNNAPIPVPAGLAAAVTAAYKDAVNGLPAPIVPRGSKPGVNVATISATSLGGTPLLPKTIQELFDPYGRMNSTLGVEIPFTTATIQTTIPYGFADPATEIIPDGATQLWKITHNGVDTHAIHFHLFNVQLVNRVGWDGAIRLPEDNEMGWKDTVRMNPLEDVIVALKAKTPTVPASFGELPNNIRPLDPTKSPTFSFTGVVDPSGNPVPAYLNGPANFGNEYTWHCHLLGHEENDMMRPIMVAVPPATGPTLTATLSGNGNNKRAVLNWNAAPGATAYTVQRASDSAFTQNLVTTPLGNVVTYTDTIGNTSAPFYYQVSAVITVGSGVAGFPSVSANSPYSNTAGVNVPLLPAAPSGLTATILSATSVRLNWTDNANNETGFQIYQSVNGGTFTLLTTVAANTKTYTDGSVTAGNTYAYQVRAVNASGASTYAGPVTVIMKVPVAPSGLTATATRNGGSDRVTLNWTDNSNNETSFTIQRSTSAGFGAGLNTSTVAVNTITTQQTGLARAATFYYRIQAVNLIGTSAWVNATPFPVTTP